jgi:hypothetical protein
MKAPDMAHDLLVIVPCGQKKLWDAHPDAGPAMAQDAYTGTPFVLNRKFAETFADSWLILSAKYGFIDPESMLPGPYNVTFKRKATDPISITALREQRSQQGLDRFSQVIGLGGKEYRTAIEGTFENSSAQLHFPFSGLPIGKSMQATKRAIEGNKPFGRQAKRCLIQTRDSVILAIKECDQLGRERFLEKYGFRPAKRYFLTYNAKHYDSKAIVGVAYGYENPEEGPLKASSFSGGAATVQRCLEQLEFEITIRDPETTITQPPPSTLSTAPFSAEDVHYACKQLHHRLNQSPVFAFPLPLDQFPANGIYILFEEGEQAHDTKRIVRIGTHTGNNQLRRRLSQHFINERKDRSIFRKNIGRCLLNKNNDPFLEDWQRDLTTRAAKEEWADTIDFSKQTEIENQVSEYMRSRMRVAVLEVPDKEQRLLLESRIISTVSLCEECAPSEGWLGQHSPKHKIRDSGLWQVNELYKTPFSEEELTRLFRLLPPRLIGFFETDATGTRSPQFGDSAGWDCEPWKLLERDFTASDYITTFSDTVGIHLVVRQLFWEGPATPMFSWFTIQTFPADTPETDIQTAVDSLVNDHNYFFGCVECHRRYPVGYMHEGYIDNPEIDQAGGYCMACAQNHGVVY